MTRTLRGIVAPLLFLVLLAGPLACSDSSTGPSNAPESHTVMEDGVAHAPGLNNPFVNCTTCHGANLQGGSDGQPSCTKCHGVKW